MTENMFSFRQELTQTVEKKKCFEHLKYASQKILMDNYLTIFSGNISYKSCIGLLWK